MILDKKYIAVCGEVCIDEYVYGSSTRNNPEDLSVPVIKADVIEKREGMSFNVRDNLKSLGCTVLLGNNSTYEDIITKTRIYNSGKMIARLDKDTYGKLFETEDWAKVLPTIVKNCNGLIVQDYGKGYWDKNTLEVIRSVEMPCFVDPYPTTKLELYKGCTLITPNLEEAKSLTGCSTVESAANELMRVTECKYAVITLGADGMALLQKNQPLKFFKPKPVNVVDVCGAGDTVIAVLSYLLLNGMHIENAIKCANDAAGLVVQQNGVTSITKAQLQSIVDGL